MSLFGPMPQTLSLSNSGVNPYTEVKVTNKYWTSDGRLMCFGEFIDPETGKYASTIINSNSDDCAFILSILANGTLINTTEPRINTSAKIANKGYTKYRVYMREICEQPIYIQELSKKAHTEGLNYEDLGHVSDEIKKELKLERKQEAVPDISIRDLEQRWGLSRNGLKARAKALGVELVRVSSTCTVWPGDYIDLGDRLNKHINAGNPMCTFPGLASDRNDNMQKKQDTAKKNEKMPYRIGVAKTTLRYKYIDKLVADSPRSQSSKNVHAETVGDLVDYCIEHNINPYQNDT